MKLPNSQAVEPHLVQRIVEYVGRDRLGESLHVTGRQIDQWAAEGIPQGPIAACFRYLATALAIPATATGKCVLCGAVASESVASTPVCVGCLEVSERKVRSLGMGYWEGRHEGMYTYVAVAATRSFERPLFAKFSRQYGRDGRDPEVGDEVFDPHVFIETDDYEAVFETFQLLRRRQLVYNLTRTGTVQIDVKDVVWRTSGFGTASEPRLPVHVVLLGWSLLYETSRAWNF